MSTLVMTPEEARQEWRQRRDLGPVQHAPVFPRFTRDQTFRGVWIAPEDPLAFVRPVRQPERPGGAQTWLELLDSIIADGTQISNTVSETIVCPDFSIPAYYMAPGRTLRIYAGGVLSNVVTTPGTLTFRLRWGGVGGTVLLASAALALDTTAHTNFCWTVQAHVVCRTAGSSGSFMAIGNIFVGDTLTSTAANLLPSLWPASGNAAVTVDTTTAKLLSLTAQFSVATSPTNLTAQIRTIESLN